VAGLRFEKVVTGTMKAGSVRNAARFVFKVVYFGGAWTFGMYLSHRFVTHEQWDPAFWVPAGLFFGLFMAWSTAERLVNRIVRWVEAGRKQQVGPARRRVSSVEDEPTNKETVE